MCLISSSPGGKGADQRMSVSITELQKHWDRAEIAGLNSSAVFQFPIIRQQSRAALVTSGASLCNLSRVFVMDVFSTSEE